MRWGRGEGRGEPTSSGMRASTSATAPRGHSSGSGACTGSVSRTPRSSAWSRSSASRGWSLCASGDRVSWSSSSGSGPGTASIRQVLDGW